MSVRAVSGAADGALMHEEVDGSCKEEQRAELRREKTHGAYVELQRLWYPTRHILPVLSISNGDGDDGKSSTALERTQTPHANAAA